MQSREELLEILEKNRPDLDQTTVDTWVGYLQQLTDCRLFSTTSPDLNEEDWLYARSAGIGGSEIAAIMGKNPWSSPKQVWENKVNYEEHLKAPQSEAARWGNLLETIVATEWALRENRNWVHIPVILQHEKYPWILANIDGFTVSDTGKITGILEVKTTTEFNRSIWEYGPIPEYYIYQANWYCLATGLTNYTMVCLVGGQSLFHYDLIVNSELHEEMIEKSQHFWYTNVLRKQEPTLAAADLDGLKTTAIDTEAPPLLLDDDESTRLVEAYCEVRSKMSALKKIKDELYAQIFGLLGTSAQAITKSRAITLRQTARRSCDYDLLAAAYPEAYDATIKTTLSKSLWIK